MSLREKIASQTKRLKRHSRLNAVVRTRVAQALEESARHQGRLSGSTILVKDNICIRGEITTCASKILEGFVAPYHATAVERIIQEGGAIVGQTNQDEFAMGSSSEYSVYGPVLNPHDPSRVPGGSSGGSAAAVAAGLADMALGSDTGGSVRQPAAFCGLYGLKPTYGRVSRYGLVAFASSFDQIGPLASNLSDTARLFVSIAGHDPRDATSSQTPVPSLAACLEGPGPRSIGVPRTLLKAGVQGEIIRHLSQVEECCRQQGIEVVEIELPHCQYAVATYYILTMAEASSNLARFDGVRYGYRETDQTIPDLYEKSRSTGFGAEVKRRIMLGTYVLSSGYYEAYYAQAQKVRRLIKEDFEKVFQSVGLILLPTAPILPFKIGSKLDNPLAMYLADVFTIPMSLAGVPALNIPAGWSRSKLPIGLQLVGNHFGEETIFSLARMLEDAGLFDSAPGT